MLPSGAAALVSDRLFGSSREWSSSFLSTAAARSGAKLVHHSDVVNCSTSRVCEIVGNIRLLQVGEVSFSGDTATIDVSALDPTGGTPKIAFRTYRYFVVREGANWVVKGTKGASYT